MTTDTATTPECADCMWEARASVGIYMNSETVPKNRLGDVRERYESEIFDNHKLVTSDV